MDRQLAHVEKIVSLTPIPGADSICTAEILGWKCVVKKNEFNVNDKVVYIEVDSIVPEKPEYEFLRERKFRVRTIRLRKQISQGLVLPLSVLPQGKYKEGQDVTSILGITKYDPQAEKEVQEADSRLKNPFVIFMSRYKWFRNIFLRKPYGGFPKWISKTDEPRVQNLPRLLENHFAHVFHVTEKLDGQSATYFVKRKPKTFLSKRGYEFGVCSRNERRGKEDSSSYWIIAKKYNIKNSLLEMAEYMDLETLVLQGEIIGERIQGNKYKISSYDFYAYNFEADSRRIDSETARDILDDFNIKFVPILQSIQLRASVQELVNMSVGMSTLKSDVMREGLVFRYQGDATESFKAINPEFLLKNNE